MNTKYVFQLIELFLLSVLGIICVMSSLSIADTRDGSDNCLKCHNEMAGHLSEVKIKHKALERGPCTICHDPHATDHPSLLKKPARELCFGCHEELGLKVRGSKFIHSPLYKNICGACHDPHGSDFASLLKLRYPPWEPPMYPDWTFIVQGLCWDCHNKDIALLEESEKITNFRNGSRNLHFVHVARKKGRRCYACHDSHASNQDKHIRPELPFGTGGFMLPIKYTKTVSGGNCVVGCHRELSYDRHDPVKYQ